MIRSSVVVLVLGILLGLGLGVLIGWVIYPVEYVDTPPNALRADYKDEYLLLIASAYAADHNLEHARQRLATLGYPDPVLATNILVEHLAIEGKDYSALIALNTDLSGGQITTDWRRFDGTGYKLVYPANWYVYKEALPEALDPSQIHYDLILSDAPNNHSPEHTMNNEQARVSVWYITRPNEPLEAWTTKRWAWMNTELMPITVNGMAALGGTLIVEEDTPVFQQFLWVAYDELYYVVQAYSLTNNATIISKLQNILASLTFK